MVNSRALECCQVFEFVQNCIPRFPPETDPSNPPIYSEMSRFEAKSH